MMSCAVQVFWGTPRKGFNQKTLHVNHWSSLPKVSYTTPSTEMHSASTLATPPQPVDRTHKSQKHIKPKQLQMKQSKNKQTNPNPNPAGYPYCTRILVLEPGKVPFCKKRYLSGSCGRSWYLYRYTYICTYICTYTYTYTNRNMLTCIHMRPWPHVP